MDVGAWLRGLGLGQYEQAFRDNAVDAEVLRELTGDDLKDLGVSLVGHRRRLLAAIAALREGAASPSTSSSRAELAPPAAPGPVARSPQAERRQLTVMFVDLVGSTALSGRLDPEEMGELLRAYQNAVAGEVTRFEGHIAKYMGDGVLAYFGYPRAHEDAAERAVRAGLVLIDAVAKLRAPGGGPLAARVGIATGLVVVGELIGSDEARERAVVGETPNLAARLQALAEPNSVVIGPSTRRLVGGLFELADLGVQALKGFAEPVQAWRVLGLGRVEGRFEARQTTSLTPLIGREEEVALLLRCWQQARKGEGQVVPLSGEPGIGKSRLTRALRERLGDEPYTPLHYQCSPYHQTSPLHPVIEQLERAAGLARDEPIGQQLDKLERLLARGTGRLDEAVPLIAALLAIPTGERYPLLNLTPQRQKRRTLEVLVDQLAGLATEQPVLVVYEDVHWSDPSTQELLGLVVERVQRLPVLVLITFRPEFTPPWTGHPHAVSLSLNRLSRRQGAALVERVTGGKALPAEVLAQIVAKTDGVPLFVEELTKTVLEAGLLKDAGARYELTGPLPPLAIPATLHDSLMARLDRLAPVKEVAQIGAAIGREFSHRLIRAVASLPRPQLDDALDQLVRAELIFRRGTPPDAEYTFKHALVQDAAYASLLRSRRQPLHARIATTLEEQFPEVVTAQPELLAHHYTEAGRLEKAIPAWLTAGQQALARSALEEAVVQLRKGLALLSGVPDDTWRRQRELELQVALGRALMATKGHASPAMGQAYARARQLCEQLNRPLQLVPVLFGQCMYHFMRAELEQARQHAAEMRRLGEAQDDVRLRLMGRRLSGQPELCLGEFAAARTHLEQGLALFDPEHRPFYAVLALQDARVALLSFLSLTLVCLGHLDQARARIDEALAEARQLGQAYTLVFALFFALFHACLGGSGVHSAHAVLRRAEELAALTTEHDFPLFGSAEPVFRGWCLVTLGQEAEGIALLRHGLAAYRATGAVLWVPCYLMLLADAYTKARQPEEGLKQLAEAAGVIETTRERWVEAELHRVRGELLKAAGDRATAEGSFGAALAVARRQSAKLWELRAAMSLARLWREQGKPGEARDLLAPIYGWFSEGFDTSDLREAKALLQELALALLPDGRGRSGTPLIPGE